MGIHVEPLMESALYLPQTECHTSAAPSHIRVMRGLVHQVAELRQLRKLRQLRVSESKRTDELLIEGPTLNTPAAPAPPTPAKSPPVAEMLRLEVAR